MSDQEPLIYGRIPRIPANVVAELSRYPTGLICDALGRPGAMSHEIKPLASPMRMAGPAVTFRGRPADNLLIWQLVEVAQQGDVLVLAMDGFMGTASCGSLVVRAAGLKGVAGAVVDGAVRDAAEIVGLGFPLFARGISPSAPYKDGPADINVPVNCGGQPVMPGDIIVGDDEGVVVVPRGRAASLLPRLQELAAREQQTIAAIEGGAPMPPAVQRALQARDYRVLDIEWPTE